MQHLKKVFYTAFFWIFLSILYAQEVPSLEQLGANKILQDWKGARYYADPEILTQFLIEHFQIAIDLQKGKETAQKTAEDILADFKGAGYYFEENILADFLRERFDPFSEEGKKRKQMIDKLSRAMELENARKQLLEEVATAILADLNGARYYLDPLILASFLEVRFGPLEQTQQVHEISRLLVNDWKYEKKLQQKDKLLHFLEQHFYVFPKTSFFVLAQQSAQKILSDFQYAGYYYDPMILANFLAVQYGPLSDSSLPEKTASAILADWNGARYYQEEQILSDFLRGQFEEWKQQEKKAKNR